MDIAVVVDNSYLQHLGVMLTSLFENNNNLKFSVHIIYITLSQSNRNKLKELITSYNNTFYLHHVDVSKVKKYFKHFGHVSKTAYIKIFIPRLIKNKKKILYIDSDIVIAGSILDIYKTNLDNKVIAATRNSGLDSNSEKIDNLGYEKKYGYFNSGLMLININKWNRLHTTQKLLNFIKNNPEKLLLWDQDAFNAILYKEWLELPAIYNFQTHMCINLKKYLGKQKPVVIHYSTSSKPWQFGCNHPYRSEYWKYLKLTEWHNFKTKDAWNLKSIILHHTPIKVIYFISNLIK